ncbi:MAG: cobalamin-binding protein [Myxococcota bacterium]|nr:cobalamin-binding protein [Myxococcota bacterium]
MRALIDDLALRFVGLAGYGEAMKWSMPKGPNRIVCLTEEPTEILYALGESARIVGISAYTVRPREAKQTKPVVSAFIQGSVPKIKALEPDLIIGFSDIQADLAKDLISANLPVVIFNQRSIQEILDVVMTIGRLVGQADRATTLVDGYIQRLTQLQSEHANARRPRVYFEEWDEPTISGIHWVSELIEIAGGIDIFHDRAMGKSAKARFVTREEIVERAPDVVLASWCGKPFDRQRFVQRPEFDRLPAVRGNHIVEIPSEIILQPGPACLTDGLDAIDSALRHWRNADQHP